ncbi:RHS repeat-associated protein [Kibdelosporangium banguiense]|uniref:RHS repeat-associated protein n=1 Tax=Kibdelosporangium banguiense TaxID=1365924 RepID=A0ABS4TVP3_9PSEU|nr:DNRLRE domain-containing protein [Kibdelosporangium banguiense]MBP2328480.1 RHS repeat-associated protein [Kibdelosporangium banguiense]
MIISLVASVVQPGMAMAQALSAASAGAAVAQPKVVPTPPAPEDAIPRVEVPPAGSALPDEVKRGPEQVDRRTATVKEFALADGRRQMEVSPRPVHYRDAQGQWQEIDTRISKAATGTGYAYVNERNMFTSMFGAATDRLAMFRLGGREVRLGAAGKSTVAEPSAHGDSVHFLNVFGEADVTYQVTPDALKEKIVLDKAPADATYTFTLDLAGVQARQREDGSIAFLRPDGEGGPVFVMPKPFMIDARDDANSPYGKAWSGKVTQTIKPDGNRFTVTVAADMAWLRAPERKYPVVIDPTIKIQPTATQAQDVMVTSDEPDRNHDGTWRLSVGTTGAGSARSLLKFDLAGIPAGTQLDSAQLQVYYDQDHTTGANDVAIEARRVTVPWTEATATWNSVNNGFAEVGQNQELVDNADTGKTAVNGQWPVTDTGDADQAVNHSYRVNRNAATGESFTWVPRLTEPGEYQAEVHYVAGADRATNAPYTVHHAGGQQTVNVNQTNGAWKPLGTWSFNAGTAHKIVLGDVSNKAVVADAVRLTKPGVQVKKANKANVWHSFSVRSTVQDWLAGTQPNNGFLLKAVDETLGRGGPRYEAAEYAYNGETAHTPKLLLTYGKPGAGLAAPTTIRATGADLTWTPYAGDDIVEYQVHRSIYQRFTPSAATLVSPVKPGATSYTDSTAEPTAADDPQPFGNAFYYVVAVKTRDGSLIPSQTQLVRLPKAGRVVKIVQGDATDTTLTAKQPDAGHDALTGEPWLMAGNSSGTFGTSRPVVRFGNLAGVPVGARVVDAEISMWGFTSISDSAVGKAVYELHGLSKTFDETTGTWNRASGSTAWTTPGGDFDPAVSSTVTGVTNDPKWQIWKARDLAQRWVNDPTTNRGALVKLAGETSPAERTLFLSSEAAEPELRPRLVVVYTEQTAESTYYAPTTPNRMIPGDEYTVPVTVTNTTGLDLSTRDWVLSYHWELADGTDYTNSGNRLDTPLPRDLPPDDVATLSARVKTPIRTDQGNKRESFVLKWDLRNKTTGKWLSQTTKVPPLAQNVTVEDPTSNQLGLEKFYQYAGNSAGAGSSVVVNQYSGNAVYGYNALAIPGRGPSSFLRMTYNSQDTSNSYIGYGWSLSTSTVMRVGTPLEFRDTDRSGPGHPGKIQLVDGDGTTHTFELNKHDSNDPRLWDYDKPAGVHLYLRRAGGDDKTRTWVMTRPDRTQFLFDADGYQTATVDKNGNELTFTYERSGITGRNSGILKYITDATGRRTLELEYYQRGDQSYDYFTGNRKTTGSNLTNGKITNQLKAIVDLSGRRLELVYSDRGLLQEITDGAGTDKKKVFTFFYNDTLLDKNTKLVSVSDPRGNSTGLAYHGDTARKWKVSALTDRRQKNTGFDYLDPDGDRGSDIESVVTDANQHSSTVRIDGFGRPTVLANAKNERTELTWDADNNVRRMAEDGGQAVTTWVYDPKTGYPTEIRDAEANAANTPPTRLAYTSGLDGHVAQPVEKISPEGRKWLFTYDVRGNLVAVTDPKGTSTPAEWDYTSTYTYDDFGQLIRATDANENPTTYGDYDGTGYPRKTTDAYGHDSLIQYDALGNVLRTVDARKKVTEYTYDVYGRPLTSKVPLDADAGQHIFTPGPEYDANDNVIKTISANNAVSTATYNETDQVTSTSAPKDSPQDPVKVTSFVYDNVGNLTRQTDPKGTLTPLPDDYTTTNEYDSLNRVSATVDANRNRTSYTYDNVGNLVSVVDPIKNATADPNDFSTKFTYDLRHQVRTSTDALGNTASQKYDRDGNTIESTDEENNTSFARLDARSALEELSVPREKDSQGNVLYSKTRYEYDEAGNNTRIISPRGVETADDPDDFAQVTVYDKLNRVVEELTPFDKDDERVKAPDKTTYAYDEVGNLTEVSTPPSQGQTIRNITRVGYFDNGWARTSTDPWNITTSYKYDELGGQKERIVAAAGGSATRAIGWEYYPDGKLKSRSDDGVPVGRDTLVVDNSDPAAVFTGTWATAGTGQDHEGFDYRHHNAGTGTETATWNIDVPRSGTYELFVRYNRTATATNASYTIQHDGASTTKTVDQTVQPGQWVSLGEYAYTEDQIRAVTLTDNADGTVVADAIKLVRDASGEVDNEQKKFGYVYDPNDNLVQMTDGSPGAKVDSYAVGYTGLNQLAKIEEKLGGVVKKTTAYTYDPNGNPKTQTHDAQSSTYDYDVRDLIAKVTSTDTGGTPQATSYTYTPRGQKHVETKANGNVVTYTYGLDQLRRSSVEKKTGDIVVSEHTLAYDANGQRVRDASKTMNADNNSAYLDFVHTYVYDPRERVRSVTKAEPGGKVLETESYAHDANNNVVNQTLEGKNTTFTYDRNRLVTSKTDQTTSVHAYDPFGRLDKVTSAGKVSEKYRYDGFDRVAEQQKLKPGTANERITTRYAYDPMDRTVTRTEGDKETSFAYLGLSNEVLTEELEGRLDKSYQYSPTGERLSQVTHKQDGTKESGYYGYNAHTDVETLTNAQGATKATYGYTAYGNNDTESFTGIDKPEPQNPTKEAYNPYRYNGKRWDSSTGDYDMGFRNYSPGRNSFLSRDNYNGALADLGLVTDPWTGNRYAFAHGNPVNRIELDGHIDPYEYECGYSGAACAEQSPEQQAQAEKDIEQARREKNWREEYDKAVADVGAKKPWVPKTLADTSLPADHHVRAWAEHEVAARFCERVGAADCLKANEHIMLQSTVLELVSVELPEGQTEEDESTRLVREATERVLNGGKGFEDVLDQLSETERALYEKNVAAGYYKYARGQLGTAIHRAVFEELRDTHGVRFEYNASNGPDFLDTEENKKVELTSKAAYKAHIEKKGQYSKATYVLYKSPGKMPGIPGVKGGGTR